MKKFLVLALFAFSAQSQTPGSVDVATTVTATAGTLICVGTPAVSATVSTMHMKCTESGTVLHEADYTVTAPGSTVYSIQRGQNTITWLLTKGNPTPDQWQVSANGAQKSGSF